MHWLGGQKMEKINIRDLKYRYGTGFINNVIVGNNGKIYHLKGFQLNPYLYLKDIKTILARRQHNEKNN